MSGTLNFAACSLPKLYTVERIIDKLGSAKENDSPRYRQCDDKEGVRWVSEQAKKKEKNPRPNATQHALVPADCRSAAVRTKSLARFDVRKTRGSRWHASLRAGRHLLHPIFLRISRCPKRSRRFPLPSAWHNEHRPFLRLKVQWFTLVLVGSPGTYLL